MNRAGNQRTGNSVLVPVAADTVIREGVMVAVGADGYAAEASKNTGMAIAGVSNSRTDNSGMGAGESIAVVERGIFAMKNDGTIKNTDVLKVCYVSAADTVTMTAEGSSVAGIIVGVEPDVVFVDMNRNCFE